MSYYLIGFIFGWAAGFAAGVILYKDKGGEQDG